MPLSSIDKHGYRVLGDADDSDENLIIDSTTSPEAARGLAWRRRFWILLVSSLTIMTVLITGFVYKLNTLTCPPMKPGVTEPYCKFPSQVSIVGLANMLAAPAPLSYVNKWLKGDPDTPKFVGKPRPEMDQAWHDLLSATAIRLSSEELLLANNASSIEHKDGGFVGGLGISHSLHCVKRIKQYMHPDYYYGEGDQEWDELFMHADHCLESLRQAVMCQADVSVYTLQWTPHSKYKPAVKVPQPHACVDWEALHGWMSERAASLDDLVGPPESLYDDADEYGMTVGHWTRLHTLRGLDSGLYAFVLKRTYDSI